MFAQKEASTWISLIVRENLMTNLGLSTGGEDGRFSWLVAELVGCVVVAELDIRKHQTI